MGRLLTISATLAAIGFASTAFAGAPVPLTDRQLDEVTAGKVSNTTVAIDTGQTNKATIVQTGSDDSASLSQAGLNNTFDITQNPGKGNSGFAFATTSSSSTGAGSSAMTSISSSTKS